jgi:hypothetical protein
MSVGRAAAVTARVDRALGAQVIARRSLLYRDGAHAGLDRPAHVRAGSALARIGAHTFAVVQDDASFVAIVTGVGTGSELLVHDVPLPATDGVRQFDDGRGNKKAKLDLEACLALDGGALLVAFGSGSSPRRERVVLIDEPAGAAPRVVVVDASALYTAMRSEAFFCGSELNIEGAALAGDDVIFLQRGNGAPCDGRLPVDASVRVDRAQLVAYLRSLARGDDETRDKAYAETKLASCPPLRDVVGWDLGAVSGTRITFTDAVATRGRWTAFLACAEDSPDATRDGPVAGVVIGRLDDRERVAETGVIVDERGEPLLDKAEGIALDDHDATRAWLVIDRDDATRPAELLELRLGSRWTNDG